MAKGPMRGEIGNPESGDRRAWDASASYFTYLITPTAVSKRETTNLSLRGQLGGLLQSISTVARVCPESPFL
jgi:hypothetical protein